MIEDLREGEEKKTQRWVNMTSAKMEETREHWFGDCEDPETEESSEEDEKAEIEEWERIERRKKNQGKRRRARERKQRKREEIANRAQRMVGLGPIRDEEIAKHMEKTNYYETAKVWAIKEHLAVNYRYNQAELDRIKIMETKISSKGDNII